MAAGRERRLTFAMGSPTPNGLVLPLPEVLVSSAAAKFDAENKMTDEETRDEVRDLLKALAATGLGWRRLSVLSCSGRGPETVETRGCCGGERNLGRFGEPRRWLPGRGGSTAWMAPGEQSKPPYPNSLGRV